MACWLLRDAGTMPAPSHPRTVQRVHYTPLLASAQRTPRGARHSHCPLILPHVLPTRPGRVKASPEKCCHDRKGEEGATSSNWTHPKQAGPKGLSPATLRLPGEREEYVRVPVHACVCICMCVRPCAQCMCLCVHILFVCLCALSTTVNVWLCACVNSVIMCTHGCIVCVCVYLHVFGQGSKLGWPPSRRWLERHSSCPLEWLDLGLARNPYQSLWPRPWQLLVGLL